MGRSKKTKTQKRFCPPAALCAICLCLVLPSLAVQRRKQVPQLTWVDSTLASMTIDEKIGQMLVPAVVGMFLSQDSETFKEIRRNISEFHVGGYHILGEAATLHEPAGVALLINRMQEAAKVPLLITADFEGGVGLRYAGATRLPRAMAIGATWNEESAYLAGQLTAREARAMGVNVNFYPVADVNNNPENPIINIRSFGGHPDLVSRMVRAYIRGSQEAGVLATAKHFPGHGDTSTDSHLELPKIEGDRPRLDATELPPFRAAISQQVAAIMTAHIALPGIEPGGVPSTLSQKILTGLLRQEMGFSGLVFTDAMNMRGISAHYEAGEAAVRAVQAGADIILYPPDVDAAFSGIKRAVTSGSISGSRIDESVRRILAAKERLNLHKSRLTDVKNLDRVLGNSEHRQTAVQIIESAVTLARNRGDIIPLRLQKEQDVLFITIVDNNEGWRDGPPGRAFLNALTTRHSNVANVFVSEKTSPAEFELIKKMAHLADAVIAATFIRVAAYKGSIDLNEGQTDLLKHISRLKKPVVFTLFGSPYLISFVPELPTYVLAYEYYPAAEEAVVKAILGEIDFKGRLPIEIPGSFALGESAPPQPR